MQTLAIVKHLDIVNHIPPRCFPREIDPMIRSLGFQTAKKSFNHRIIPAITFSAHAANHAMLFQLILVDMAGILAATIRMMEKLFRWLPALDRHGQGVDHQCCFHTRIYRPTYDFT